jgi:glucokinase
MYIVIDIGGTKTRVAQVRDLSEPVEVIDKFPTARSAKTGMASVISCIKDNVDEEIKAVAIAIAGAVDEEKRLLAGPNLPGWVGEPLAEGFSELLPISDVVVANDTAIGGLGEAVAGAGTANGITAYFTVGTGVGGARIVDGKIDRSAAGFEPGHQVVDISDWLDQSGDIPAEGHIPGHLEYYLSGANIKRVTGQDPVDVTDEALWSEFQDRLVAALNNIIVMWSPNVIVMGGSMIIRNEYLSFAYMQKELEKKVKIFPVVPTLHRAQLQDNAGLVGARELLRQHLS